MLRVPDVDDLRAALWARRAVRSVRSQLRCGAVRDVRVAAPPSLRPRAARAVRRVLEREEPSCLERALVLQRWLLAHGVARDVVIGTEGTTPELFAAHAWLDGEVLPPGRQYVEMTRIAP